LNKTRIFLNGELMGTHDDPEKFVTEFRSNDSRVKSKDRSTSPTLRIQMRYISIPTPEEQDAPQ